MNLRRFGAWMGAAALLVQILIPFILALDIKALSADAEEHAHHIATVSHLRAAHADNSGGPANNAGSAAKHAAHQHLGCPLCLALHAAGAALPLAVAGLPEGPLPRRQAPDAAVTAAEAFPCPASYLSRAPPAFA